MIKNAEALKNGYKGIYYEDSDKKVTLDCLFSLFKTK